MAPDRRFLLWALAFLPSHPDPRRRVAAARELARGLESISSRAISFPMALCAMIPLVPPELPLPDEPVRPRISVVLVARNCEAALRRSVAALEASQGRDRLEILVVDAGSSDGSPRIDADYPAVTVLRLPRNFGRTRARNIGMRTAQADLVLFLDPHVELQPDAVDALAELLESRPDAVAAAPVLAGGAGQPVASSFALPTSAQLAAASLRGTPLPRRAPSGDTVEAVEETAILVRRNFIAGMNYLDEKRFSEYWSLLEVCWQIRNAGKTIVVSPRAQGLLHTGWDSHSEDADHIADRVSGAAAYIAKHNGLGAGISFRLKCFLSALASFRLPLAFSILAGSRIDPTQ